MRFIPLLNALFGVAMLSAPTLLNLPIESRVIVYMIGSYPFSSHSLRRSGRTIRDCKQQFRKIDESTLLARQCDVVPAGNHCERRERHQRQRNPDPFCRALPLSSRSWPSSSSARRSKRALPVFKTWLILPEPRRYRGAKQLAALVEREAALPRSEITSLHGKAATANGRLAYEVYEEAAASNRWRRISSFRPAASLIRGSVAKGLTIRAMGRASTRSLNVLLSGNVLVVESKAPPAGPII